MRLATFSAAILLTAQSFAVGADSAADRQGVDGMVRRSVIFGLVLAEDTSRLEPKSPKNDNRGDASEEGRENDNAIAELNDAIDLDPTNAQIYGSRGCIWIKKKDYGKALDDFNRALSLAPDKSNSYNNVAMLRATCPEERYRNGPKAVELAKKACDLSAWKYYSALDTLAAAYAEAGDFDAAIKFQQKAIDLNPIDKQFCKRARSRLALYEDHKPYRE